MSAHVYQKQTSALFSSNPYGPSDIASGLSIFGRNEAPSFPSGIPIADGSSYAQQQQQQYHHPAAIAPLGHPNEVGLGSTS
jgi:hypothetical protein